MSVARSRVVVARWHAPRLFVVWLALVMMGLSASGATEGVVVAPPAPVVRLDLRSLAGEWFEVARWGSAWAHRRCVADTRFVFSVVDSRQLSVLRSCTTSTGVEMRRGRLTGAKDGSGALRGRFVVRLFSWMPAAWSEYWVLASGPSQEWLLIGDRAHERLSVWSRVVALEESAMAAAIAAGRTQGFDASRLTPVTHPAGPGAMSRSR